jgi:hypothetical protein
MREKGMDRITTLLLFYFFLFAAAALSVMPGLPVGISRGATYIAGISIGIIIGASMTKAGWIWN